MCRFAHFMAAMLAFGASAYLWLLTPEKLRRALSPTLWRLSLVASVIALVTAIIWLALESAAMADDWMSAYDPGAIGDVLTDTAFGHAWAAHLILAAALVAVVGFGPRGRWATDDDRVGGSARKPRPRRPRRDADRRRGRGASRQSRRTSPDDRRVDRRPRSVRDVPRRL